MIWNIVTPSETMRICKEYADEGMQHTSKVYTVM